MASTIKVNNIQNQCGANIVNKCSTTITLGASGDNITLAAGATQSGFGRTGTVNWDTTAKTAGFTAVSGNGYFVNTTSGAITVTLPATPSAGDIVAIADYANTWQTNNVTVARNGSLINGQSFDYIGDTEGISLTFVYVDGTRGWKNVNDGTTNASGTNPFIAATGGTITTSGDYKIHTFTGPGTFTVTCAGTPAGSTTVDYLVVAGGGGGGNFGGGGGGGGFRESSGTASGCYTASPLGACVAALPVSATAYPITVGGGGAAGTAPAGRQGGSGSNSIALGITSTGGGGGGGNATSDVPNHNGLPGGSGGGESQQNVPNASVGSGNTPPVSPPQGNDGGNAGGSATPHAGGAGGGATAVGGNGTPGGPAGTGGTGATSSINGTPTGRAGGGGGGGSSAGASCKASSCGSGADTDTAASANTGGGGGASSGTDTAGAGGSGIVIIRYKYQ